MASPNRTFFLTQIDSIDSWNASESSTKDNNNSSSSMRTDNESPAQLKLQQVLSQHRNAPPTIEQQALNTRIQFNNSPVSYAESSLGDSYPEMSTLLPPLPTTRHVDTRPISNEWLDNDSLLSSSMPSSIPTSLRNLRMDDFSQDEGITSSDQRPESFRSPISARSRSVSLISHSDGNSPSSSPIGWTGPILERSDLRMPRVQLPTSKPFTENGLKLGKLKILIAGKPSTGKSSFISSLTSVADDIVHVDSSIQFKSSFLPSTDIEICETTASTKPMPLFRTNNFQPHSSQASSTETSSSTASTSYGSSETRRHSLVHSEISSTDGALDRNICFTDTYQPSNSDFEDYMNALTNYLDEMFRQTASVLNVCQQERAKSLISSGSSLSDFGHVDVCFYLINGTLDNFDLDCFKSISEFAPVIPIIAHCDQLKTKEAIVLGKLEILKALVNDQISPFLFDTKIEDAIGHGEQLLQEIRNQPDEQQQDTPFRYYQFEEQTLERQYVDPLLFPCTVSSLRDDREDLLASVLMSPDYKAPLVPSEIKHLVKYVFSDKGAAWLRYETALRFSSWCANLQINSSLVRLGFNEFNGLVHIPAGYRHMDDFDDYRELQFVLPEWQSMHGYEPRMAYSQATTRNRAQSQTARWVMLLEQESRKDNAIAIRTRNSVASRRRTSKNYTRRLNNNTDQLEDQSTTVARPTGKLSESIHNIDPLNLKKLPQKLLSIFLKAASVLAGIKLVSWLWSSRTQKIEPVSISWQSLLTETLESVSQSSSTIVVSALNSLGGGWSTITVA